jgi:hypothetical protein
VLPLILTSQFDIEAVELYICRSSAEARFRSYSQSLWENNANLLYSFSAYVFRQYSYVAPDEPIYMQKLRAEQLHAIATRYGFPDDLQKDDAT